MLKGKTLVLDDKGGATLKGFKKCAAKKYFEDGIRN